jgi:4-hydroxy-2-oxoheptanedioate aldolase
MVIDLKNSLSVLNSKYGIIGMKQSFEDEGVLLNDVVAFKRVTEVCGLQSFVKIGGCEAKSDLFNCVRMGIDGVIAPMVETPFALSKFIDMMDEYKERADSYIVIESQTSYKNIDEILNEGQGKLKGIIVGRSDFSKSYKLNKSEVDSDFIYNKVEDILVKAKKNNYITTMGGNISTRSTQFIKDMYQKNLLDRIETRNVVIEINEQNLKIIDKVIQKALDFEIEWLQYKLSISSKLSSEYSERIGLLKNRK